MELFKLFGTIAINNSGANGAIDETSGKAEKAESKISGAFKKVGGAAVKMGAAAVTAVGSVAAGIGALAKQSLDAYADYEQLVGGIETLFGAGGKSLEEYAESVGKTVDEVQGEYEKLMNAQSAMVDYADRAYETCGLSANEYMDNVTSFSASLIASLDGDTEKAAAKADQIMVQMSDNANKMGTSMESIQNAYQGFSKQNYTMLDNLKLGYGGTKEEMQRLLDDANEINKQQGIITKYSIENFGDIADAINVIQTKLDITGTTAKEASTTISGSLGMMKAQWKNLITALAGDDWDIGVYVSNLADTIKTFLGNVVPVIIRTIPNIVDGLTMLIESISEYIPDLLDQLLPSLVKGSIKLLIELAKKIPSILKTLYSTLKSSLGILFGTIFDELPDEMKNSLGKIAAFFQPLTDAFKKLFSAIGNTESTFNLSDAFSTMTKTISKVWNSIGQPIFDMIVSGINWLADNWDAISQNMSAAFSDLWGICQSIWDNVGQPIFDAIEGVLNYLSENSTEIFDGISAAFSGLWDFATTVWYSIGQPIFDLIGDCIDILLQWWTENFDEIEATTGTVFEEISVFWDEHLKPCFEAIGAFIQNVLAPAFKIVFENHILPLVEKVFKEIGKYWNGTLKPVFTGIIDFITGVFSGDWEKAFEGIISVAEGLLNGIVQVFMTPFELAKTYVENAINTIKGFFDFEWSLPHLKLPHFSIQGEFSLNPPSVPHLGIDWYAKAMNDPMVMNSPTIFGFNPATGQAMAGGEAGSEVVSGTNTLMNMISDAVDSKNSGIIEAINRLLDFLKMYIPDLANMQIVMDSGAVVGELAPAMDDALGNIYERNSRYTT